MINKKSLSTPRIATRISLSQALIGVLCAATVLLGVVLSSCKKDTPTSPPAGGGNQVTVTLREYTITMSDTIKGGLTDFKVSNIGTMTHNFGIEGNGIDTALTNNLAPSGIGTLELTLAAGTYHVYCPIANHQALGMSRQLTVKMSSAAVGQGD